MPNFISEDDIEKATQCVAYWPYWAGSLVISLKTHFCNSLLQN